MDWTDITIEVERNYADAAQAAATAVADNGLHIEDYADMEAQVWEIAHVDLIEQDLLDQPKDIVKIHIYVSPDENPLEMIEKIQNSMLRAEVEYTLSTNTLRQQDWENAWKQYYRPMDVGARLAIVPSWETYETKRKILQMDPGMAFGTGTHETTLLCLQALDQAVHGGETVLDIGTGSGILAVAALLLGAESALGIDIDPMCVRTATENAQRNKVEERFSAQLGDLAVNAKGPYSIITANIIADAIIRLAPEIPALLASGGLFLASGIIDTRSNEVEEALQQCGFIKIEKEELNGWVLFKAWKA